MAARRLTCLGLNAVYSTVCSPNQALRSCWGAVEQMRSYYVDWRMLRDVKRRQMAFDYADERLRINALRKNTILPKELQVGSSFLFTTSSSLCHTMCLTVCSYYLKSHDFTKVLVAHTIYVKQLKVMKVKMCQKERTCRFDLRTC
uniref:Mitochondrial ribosomal protein S14 n=1 Tax=Oryzias latipes TaxID=8090 RepID=A0A3P9KWE1_ORYLA